MVAEFLLSTGFSKKAELRQGYFACHAPAVPAWFTSTVAKTKVEMIPDPERGKGYVKSNTVVIEETPLPREVRWRFTFADALLLGARPRS